MFNRDTNPNPNPNKLHVVSQSSMEKLKVHKNANTQSINGKRNKLDKHVLRSVGGKN